MSDYRKGGRAKQAPYSTATMRIPDPLREKVKKMIEDFHSELEAAEWGSKTRDDSDLDWADEETAKTVIYAIDEWLKGRDRKNQLRRISWNSEQRNYVALRELYEAMKTVLGD